MMPAAVPMKSKSRNVFAKIVHSRARVIHKRGNTLVDVDDTASSSSMNSVESKGQKNGLSLKVSIDESQNVFHDPIKIDFEDRKQLWYTDDECKQWKIENNAIIRDIYQSGSADSKAYLEALNTAYVACCENRYFPRVQAQEMKNQAEKFPQHAGLEQRLARSGGTDMKKRRDGLICLAYNLVHDHSDLSLDEIEELMRTKCEEVTLPARLFAEVVGRVHARKALI